MVTSVIVRTVDFCARRAWLVVAYSVLLAAASLYYSATHFSIDTDTEKLISRDLPWRQRAASYTNAFPQSGILVVVTAATTEGVEQATTALQAELSQHPDLFLRVARVGGGEFFEKNALLFEPLIRVTQSLNSLSNGTPLIQTLASDPSLRGVMNALALAASGVSSGSISLDELEWPVFLATAPLRDAIDGKVTPFSWQALVQGAKPSASQLRRFIEVEPILNFSDLRPGSRATSAIRQSAARLKLQSAFGAAVQLTGAVPMNDDQFSVIQNSAVRDTLTALLGTLIILWLALHSWKIVMAVFASVIVGLSATAALGLVMIGAFNLISIAFFVLFVGLGVDFGIQFTVRYRSERYKCPDLHQALCAAARAVAIPLSLAAAATAAAFFSFLPTNYAGLFELGLIAGCGMLVAFLCAITVVPAMLAILQPPVEPAPIGFKELAPLDHFLQRHRLVIVAGTVLAALAGVPVLAHLPFDFNPINLQDPNAPSVITYRELQGSSLTNGTDADVVAVSLDEADRISHRLASLPDVAQTLTLSSFVPSEQGQKIDAIKSAASGLRQALDQPHQAAPSDRDITDAIQTTVAALSRAIGTASGSGANAARQFSELLTRLAQADIASRERAASAFVPSLSFDLRLLRSSLEPQVITAANLPLDLVRNWLLSDGRARVEVLPKGDVGKLGVLRRFATSVLSVEPSATGPAINLYESGRTVVQSFIQAGALAFTAISVLLLISLRKVADVLLTLTPLLLAGTVTLELATLTHTAINFANIIALPLLLGVGVAFKIYYVLAWREGKTDLLQSSLTRAVVFSAMTTAIAFGSMWASNSPGMSSMGKMMALALICTMAAAVLFQPLLMGPPRQVKAGVRNNVDAMPDAAE
ncbi:hopanoid biosynthesis-associated RND transporter HpnN [Bradyrhizobium sp. MOS001]|nr:hopanoid biosynthesis-associated RND transporter HpnN [Bradyrhizobium sp. MOS001]